MGTGGAAEGNGGYWRGCRGCRGRSASVRSVCTVMLVQTWMSGTRGYTWAARPRPTSVRICQTMTVLKHH